MPYEEYDPEKNWVAENVIGRETGLGRGTAGMVGNAEYYRQQSEGGNIPPGYAAPRRPSKPLFPFVDDWVNLIPKWAVFLLVFFGAAVGYVFGVQAGWDAWVGLGAGALGGLMLIPVIALTIKLVLLAICLATAGGVFYLIYLMLA